MAYLGSNFLHGSRCICFAVRNRRLLLRRGCRHATCWAEGTSPNNGAFGPFFKETNPFQDICNVVYSALGDLKLHGCFIQIQRATNG